MTERMIQRLTAEAGENSPISIPSYAVDEPVSPMQRSRGRKRLNSRSGRSSTLQSEAQTARDDSESREPADDEKARSPKAAPRKRKSVSASTRKSPRKRTKVASVMNLPEKDIQPVLEGDASEMDPDIDRLVPQAEQSQISSDVQPHPPKAEDAELRLSNSSLPSLMVKLRQPQQQVKEAEVASTLLDDNGDDTASLSSVNSSMFAEGEVLDNIVVRHRSSRSLHDGDEEDEILVQQTTRRKTAKTRAKPTSTKSPAKTPRKTFKKDPTSSLLTPPNSAKTPIPRRPKKEKSATQIQSPLDTLPSPSEAMKPGPPSTAAHLTRLDALLAKVDPELYALSRKLERRNPLGEKPDPEGRPEVWADSRQALCETLPYFKKPQGGCYSNDGHVYGFLFDSVGHCREYVDPDLIICRAGGGMEMDADGQMVQKRNQLMTEAQPIAIQNDIKHRNPLIVICGNRNVKAMCKMPHLYCVLDWFKPVAIWSEKTMGKGSKQWTTIKYRLERLNADRKAAWAAPTGYAISDDELLKVGPLARAACISCRTEYPQIYLPGWMCLNAACDDFWTIGGEAVCCGKLPYNPAFLLHREPRWAVDGEAEIEPAPLRPAPPKFGDLIGDNLSYVNTRGICCPLCGRCNPRRLFRGWVCEAPGCDFTLFPVHKPVVPTMLHTPWEAAPTLVRNKFDEDHGARLEVWNQHGYKVCKYTFDGVNGCLIHAAAGPRVNQEPGEPDNMLANLQMEDMGLERRTFAVKKTTSALEATEQPQEMATTLPTPPHEDVTEVVKDKEPAEEEPAQSSKKKPEFEDGDLMTAFSMNYGMPYKFVASGASRPFEGAPRAVIDARARLNWAARTFINDPLGDMDLNEELIFAYLQGQKIEYHDDGESGLGPRIATLSLGGRAQMHLRMKQKHYVGCSKTGLFSEDEPLPCSSIGGQAMYLQRKQAWDELQALKDESRAAYNQRRKELPLELGLYAKRMKKAPDLITVSLSHGDIVLMDGYDIQKYMEHKVVPEGYLRFALTCRTILEDHLQPEERAAYVVLPEAEAERYPGPCLGGNGETL